MKAANAYARPAVGWVKRRARRLQLFFGIGRRVAVLEAWRDYVEFSVGRAARLAVIPGGKRA